MHAFKNAYAPDVYFSLEGEEKEQGMMQSDFLR